MSTMSQNRTPEEYAVNYPVITKDGFYGPLSVGNIVEYNGRTLMNICVKTSMSGERNAVASYPSAWFTGKKFPFAPGDQVNVIVSNGYISKAFHAKPKTIISAAYVNKQVADSVKEIKAEQAVKEVMNELAKAVPAGADEPSPF